MTNFTKIKRVHFIGIGGIGISAVARMMLLQGKKVSGSDASLSEITDELKKMGVKISIGHRAENVPKDCDLVVYTIAIRPDNPEFLKAKELNIPTISYPESLSLISKDKFTIAVSGTHGKTTTTAMIAKMMIDAGLDPTVIVGSLIKVEGDRGQTSNNERGLTSSDLKGTNFIGGRSNYLVVEACEYRRSFLNINPTIAVITNVDDDHLDYYKDIKDIESAFGEFVAKVPKNGFVVYDLRKPYAKRIVKKAVCNVLDYSKQKVAGLKLKVPGAHNLENAKVVLAVGRILGIERERIIQSLSEYSGVWRRFEYKGAMKSGALVYDDYGHHPSEIKATLKGARGLFPKSKITVVFQPHLYSRTKILLAKFTDASQDADNLILLPIYAAREPVDPSISSEILEREIAKKTGKNFVRYIVRNEEIEKILLNETNRGDVIITMGAGDVYKVGEAVLKKNKK